MTQHTQQPPEALERALRWLANLVLAFFGRRLAEPGELEREAERRALEEAAALAQVKVSDENVDRLYRELMPAAAAEDARRARARRDQDLNRPRAQDPREILKGAQRARARGPAERPRATFADLHRPLPPDPAELLEDERREASPAPQPPTPGLI